MIRYKQYVYFLFMIQLIFFISAVTADAGESVYVALSDGEGGIVRLEDKNGDKDALDDGEFTIFTRPGIMFMDVAVDRVTGTAYAIEKNSGAVYRIEDLNGDGDALDAGELVVFRASDAPGVTLSGPLSIGVANSYDTVTQTNRTLVYVMDLALQLIVRLEDRNGDNLAQGYDEAIIFKENVEAAPFTARRMAVDEVGRLFTANANTLSLVRLEDINGDGFIDEPQVTQEPLCPDIQCPSNFPGNFIEFHTIRQPVSEQFNFDNPFGIAVAENGDYFVSEVETNNECRVIRLVDENNDDDTQDQNELLCYYGLFNSEGRDLAVDVNTIVYVAENGPDGFIITRLEDLNGNGNANDEGEATLYAIFLDSEPYGLATRLTPSEPLAIEPLLNDVSPMKGPVLVVEDGVSTFLQLHVTDRTTGQPAADVRVGSAVVAGCLSLCPLFDRTDGSGIIEYEVLRTKAAVDSPGGGESLRFRVYGNEVIIPVVSAPCMPSPIADTGPDQEVLLDETVTLDGSDSEGEGLEFCWVQTGGEPVGLPERPDDCPQGQDATVTFTAPDFEDTLTFDLYVRNACDEISGPEESVVEVYEGCPAEAVLGDDRTIIANLVQVRNRFLARTSRGKTFIKDYYRYAGELTKIVTTNAHYRKQALRIIQLFLPEINRLLDGKKIVIREEKLKEASTFLSKIKQAGSPPLQAFLDSVQKQLFDNTILDMFYQVTED